MNTFWPTDSVRVLRLGESDPPLDADALGDWILGRRWPYTVDQDEGVVLRGSPWLEALRFGFQDAIVVPVLDAGHAGRCRVIGFAAALSCSPDVYDAQAVEAFLRLTRTMIDESAEGRSEGREAHPDEDSPAGWSCPPELADSIGGKLLPLRAGIARVRRTAPSEEVALQRAVQELNETFGAVWNEMFSLLTGPARKSENLVSRLTPREKEVAELVAKGHSNREIARCLYISEPTVKTHVSRILRKLGVGQRAEITALVRSAPRRVCGTPARDSPGRRPNGRLKRKDGRERDGRR
ncbi:LuxR C-terminal-related transcriptional regulator [Amycolatopsis sp. NPDC058340]|uniref:helix-turn-helix transcriptional regulator n=1 Tax=Amycolatopsis sp. NPDC058340 TaxID=3346453 RepID=UPI0036543C90